MRLARFAKTRLAWIVTFTILLAALLPTLSHFVLPKDSAAWAEVCTATGAKFVRVDAGAEPGDPAGTPKALMECPYCAIHHGTPLLPPAQVAWAPPGALKFEHPRLFLEAPRPLFSWAPLQARAPPALA